MKRKAISILILLLVVTCLYACGKENAHDTDAVTSNNELNTKKAEPVMSKQTVEMMKKAMESPEESGVCGIDAVWYYAGGVLVISGTGEMIDYGYTRPWNETEKEINWVIVDEGITSIGANAFAHNGAIRKVVLPNGLKNIKRSAFEECENLTSIIIPDSVTTIGSNAFYYCKRLANVIIPDSVTIIGYNAFSLCSKLISIHIPDSVTTIGEDAFNNVTHIKYHGTAQDPSEEGDGMWGARYMNCYEEGDLIYSDSTKTTILAAYDVPNIIIPNSVTTIGKSAFREHIKLESIVIPDSVTTIDNMAFYGCSSLTGITIPDSVTTIGNYAFSQCVNLINVIIPDSVTTIGEYAFGDVYHIEYHGIASDTNEESNGMWGADSKN